MIEVLRSKIFYARSRLMLVLPTFSPLPEQAVLCALLGQVKSTLMTRGTKTEEGSLALRFKSSAAARCIESIECKRLMASRSYFSRVWTLVSFLQI